MTSATPSWVTDVPLAPVHTEPVTAQETRPFTNEQLAGIGGQFLEQFLAQVVKAVTGAFIPGIESAFKQLAAWAADLPKLTIDFINAMVALISDTPALIEAVINAAIGWVTDIPSLALSVINALLSFLTTIPDVLTSIITAITGWVTEIPDFVTSLVTAALNFVTSLPSVATTIINAFISWGTEIPTFITDMITAGLGFITSLTGVADSIVNAVISWADEIPTFITSLITAALSWVKTIPEVATSIITALVSWADEIPTFITSLVTAVLGFIKDIPNVADSIITALTTWVTDIPTFVTSIVSALLSWVTSLTGVADSIIHAFTSWVTEIPDFLTQIISAMLSWITSIPNIASAIAAALTTWVDEIPTFITQIVTAMASWVTEIPQVTEALISAMVSWAHEIPTFITSLVNAMLTWIQDVPNLIESVFTTVLGWVTSDSGGLGSNVITSLLSVITSIPDTITSVVTTALNWLTTLPAVATDVINALLSVVTEIPDLAVAVVNSVIAWVTALPDVAVSIINGIVAVFTAAPQLITTLITAFLDVVKDIPTVISSIITGVLGWVTNDGTGNFATSIITAVTGWFTNIPNLLATVITSMLGLITDIPILIEDIVHSFITWLTNAPALIETVINALLTWVTQAPTLIANVINAFVGALTEIPDLVVTIINGFVTWFQSAPELITTLTNAVLALVNDLPDLISGIINSVLGWVTNDSTGGFATSIINAVTGWITNFPTLLTTIVNAFLNLIKDLPDIIQSIITAVLDWITSLPTIISDVITAIVGWVEAVPNLAGSILTAVVNLIAHAPEIAASIVSAILTVIEDAPSLILDIIAAILAWIDDLTGLNLASWAGLLGGFFGGGTGSKSVFSLGGLLSAFTNSVLGFSSNANSALPNLGVGQLISAPLNLLIDGFFGSSNSFNPGGGFAQTGATSILGGIGSAVATVSSGIQSIIGNLLGVKPQQTVSVSTGVGWGGITTSPTAGVGGIGGPGTLTQPPIQANLNLYGIPPSVGGTGPLLTTVTLAATGGIGGAPAVSSSRGIGPFGVARGEQAAPASRGTISHHHETGWHDVLDDRPVDDRTGRERELAYGTRGAFGIDENAPIDPVADWVQLEGSYVIPDLINGQVPASYAVSLSISDEIDGGNVYFSKAATSKIDLMRQELVQNLPADKKAIIDASAGMIDATTADIQNRLQGISAGTGAMDWTYMPDLRTLNDSVVIQLNNWDGTTTDYAHVDAAAALASQRSAALNANSTIAKIQYDLAALTAVVTASGKVNVVDEFQRTSNTSLGSNWTQYYSGSGNNPLATSDGQTARWYDVDNMSATRYGKAVHVTPTGSDYQIVKQVLASQPVYRNPYYGAYGSNEVLGRVGAGATEFMRFKCSPIGWTFEYVVSGVGTTIASGTAYNPTSMTLVCGDLATTALNFFYVFYDNTLLWSGTASGYYGSSYRNAGFGSNVNVSSGFSPSDSGWIDTWTLRDQ